MGVADRFDKANKNDSSQYLGIGVALGTAIGAGFGVAIHNIAVGIGCGLALGICFGSLKDRKAKRDSDKTGTNLPGSNS